MTRKESKEKKLKEEKEFIESIKGKFIDSRTKDKFRCTTTWKLFREKFKNRVDPVSLKKLPKRWQLHHCCLDPREYTNLKMDNFEAVNGTVHDLLHYLYSIYRKDKQVLKRIKKILDKMDRLNNGKDIRDFK